MTYVGPQILAATIPDAITFVLAALMVLAGAIGVVVSRNPVHSALMLVMTLFGVAVLFLEQEAGFIAAVQIIVYAGAIVVLFLFVIMLLGVDRKDAVGVEPLRGQRPMAFILAALGLAGILILGFSAHWVSGAHSVAGPLFNHGPEVQLLGKAVFTTYLLPFEVTAALLVVAVVGAVLLVRRPGAAGNPQGTEGKEPAASSNEPAHPGGKDLLEPGAEAEELSDPGMGAGAEVEELVADRAGLPSPQPSGADSASKEAVQ
ncbi:MAG: NADH-quinone oxidoreductase subunit J [Actinobacteria bacterium]|nr:NADH-quinone oxidoreductase subunit J [Actinomycetota bacterium]